MKLLYVAIYNEWEIYSASLGFCTINKQLANDVGNAWQTELESCGCDINYSLAELYVEDDYISLLNTCVDNNIVPYVSFEVDKISEELFNMDYSMHNGILINNVIRINLDCETDYDKYYDCKYFK